MEEVKNTNEEILTTDIEIPVNSVPLEVPVHETTNSIPELNQELPVAQNLGTESINPTPVVTPQVEVMPQLEPVVEPVPVMGQVQTVVTPEPVEIPAVTPTQPVVEPVPVMEQVQTVVTPEPVETPAVTPTQPVVEPVPVMEQVQTVVTPEPVETPAVTPTQPVVEPPTSSIEPEEKSSVLKVLLMILLILAIMAGGYYVYKEYFAKPVEEESPEVLEKEDENKDKVPEVVASWNGVYKLDGGVNTQLLLFEEAESKASLMIAREVEKDGKKTLEYSHHYLKELTNKDGKLQYNIKEKPILEITRMDSKVIIAYVGEEANKADFTNILGVYSKLKEAKTYSAEEFVKE